MKIIFCTIFFSFLFSAADAQKITDIELQGKKLQVLDMTTMGRVAWGGYEEIGDNVRSEDNGAANTAAIVKAVGDNKNYKNKPYAAILCDTSSAGGYTDWYLPAKSESEIIHANVKLLGLGEKLELWTSTEANGTQAFTKYLYSGAFYKSQKVNDNHFVCVRKPD